MDTSTEVTEVAQPAIVLDLSKKGISDLAYIVRRDWKKVNYAAKPYLDAMFTLTRLTDKYGYDSGDSIVRYFLANASSWRGEVAKQVKAELNKRLKKGESF